MNMEPHIIYFFEYVAVIPDHNQSQPELLFLTYKQAREGCAMWAPAEWNFSSCESYFLENNLKTDPQKLSSLKVKRYTVFKRLI